MLGTYHVRCSGGDLVRKDRTSYELQVSHSYEERIKMHIVVGWKGCLCLIDLNLNLNLFADSYLSNRGRRSFQKRC